MRSRSLGLVLLGLVACGGGDAPIEPAPVDLALDPRITLLLQGCPQLGYYDRDTGDPLGILIEKLRSGQADPMRRAKEELASLGDLGAEEVGRLLNLNFDSEQGTAAVQNALDVLSLSESEVAHDPLMRCLDHPRDAVRAAALRALARGHARPQDFDRIRQHIPGERPSVREVAVQALDAADPARAETVFLEWVTERRNVDLLGFAVGALLDTDSPDTPARCSELWRDYPGSDRAVLAAIAARGGDEEALAFLFENLTGEDTAAHLPVASALLSIGKEEEVAAVCADSEDPTLRTLVAQAVAALEPLPDWGSEVLRERQNDPVGNVRQVAIGRLLREGDPGAIDRLLALLGGTRRDLQDAVPLLVDNLQPGTEVQRRVLARLLELERERAHLPVAKRVAVLQAIGQVPTAEAALYLHEVGLAAEGEVQGLRGFRWAMIQAANTGPAGRRALFAELDDERDPEHRIDVLWAVSSERDDTSRELLTEHVQRTDIDPYELLFASERLANLGPTTKVAPLLKRVTLAVEQREVRDAMTCLLWRWF